MPTTRSKRGLRWAAVATFAVSFIFSSGVFAEEVASRLTPVRYLPHWVPQAQFAGFYVAADQGFYEEAGLAVEILQGGPERPPSRLLAEGKVDFATLFLAQGILMRGDGIPVVNLAQLLDRSSLLLVTHSDSGIEGPADLDGRKVAVWPEFRAQPKALFRRFGVEPTIVEQGASLGVFLWRGVDAACAMRYNEFQQLYLSGFEESDLRVIELDAHGVGFPEDGIYALEPTVRKAPEVASAFVSASLRGWKHAFEHPEEAIDSVMRRVSEAGLTSNRPHQRRMLATLREVYLDTDGNLQPTILSADDFDFVSRALMDFGDLHTLPDYETFHRPDLLTR